MTRFAVHDLSVSFGTTRALDDVSLELEPGQVQAVIGGDGAGKSTLLKVLAGLDVGQTGDVRIPAADRIGYVPSAGGIFADLTVGENIEFAASAYGLTGWADRAAMLLDRAGIGRFEDRLAGAMSGGQRRKLAGCMALLHQPELLILDEVTTGVDPLSRMELWRLLAGSAAAGAAVVVATTYLDEAERMGAVLLLDHGRVLASGPPSEIVAGTGGAVMSVEGPDDPTRAWRSGRRWRQWVPTGALDGREQQPLSLEDAVIIRELDQARGGNGQAAAPRSMPPTARGDGAALPASARNLSKSFGPFVAVDGIDLDVEAGEIVALLGANGAGKTTAIKMVLGLLLPTVGTIKLFGEPITREQRRRIGYVPQNLGLYQDLTEHENLQFRSQVFASPPVDSPAEDDRLVKDQSLGAQRWLAFRAATQHGPELLVLDEPTSGVSPLARSRLWDLIHAQSDAGVGVLVSTHYMDEAVQADRLVVLSRGRLVAAGTVDTVLAGREVVEVSTENWALAFDALDRPGRLLRLAGRTVRVLGETVDTVRTELDQQGLEAEVRATAADLEEALIVLDSDKRPSAAT